MTFLQSTSCLPLLLASVPGLPPGLDVPPIEWR